MNEELKNKLIASLQAKGLGKEVADLISINDESEIEGVVAKAVSLLVKPDKTKEEKLADKEVQSEIDRRVTEALKKAKAPENTDPTLTKPDETHELIKALMQKVDAMEQGKTLETKQQQAQSLLKKSEVLSDSIKEKWISRINVNSEIAIEDQIKGLESEYTELRQGIIDSTPLSGSPSIHEPTGKASDSEIESIMGSFNLQKEN